MKNKPERRTAFLQKLFPASLRTRPTLAWAGAFLLCLLVVLFNMNANRDFDRNLGEFEAGKVAERDVIADRFVSYEDEQATFLMAEVRERLVPAVFRFSGKTTDEIREEWNRFSSLAEHEGRLRLESEYPGVFSDSALDALYRNQAVMLRDCAAILDALLERGIYFLPYTGLQRLNPDVLELIRQSGTRIEQEKVSFRDIITRSGIAGAVEAFAAAGSWSSAAVENAPELLGPFLRENVFYSVEDTIRRVIETRAGTEKVMRSIEQGKRIIRRGFVVTEDEMKELRALGMAPPGNDFSLIFTNALFLFLLFGFLWYFCGRRIAGRDLTDRETYLVSGLSALYIAGTVLVRNIFSGAMPVSIVVPTALVILLPSIFINARMALVMAMTLPLGAFLTGSFNAPSYIFALVSGAAAAYSLQGAEKRMDLVKAGLIIAAANLAAMIAVLLWQRLPAGVYPHSLFWAAFNGIASGMLVLGVLPPLEHALNAATSFRLIELSDLNAPVLRRLFTTAPGTYSHSIMVANLAEAACQDIGANPLLARVGAYYHDLGKMENPGYFVENQENRNPHDEMAPRLSATVIRSHVKLGMEKARQLGLPREVIDIIGEHHGDSVITWFYSKALKQEGGDQKKADIDDFRYPGTPPRSRESAVVMLADVTEAAVRTVNKPTAQKIEKFVQELIQKKMEHGQLALSELSFRDIETIKKAFVQVLSGYYHSRIEYPKIDEDGK